MLIEASDAGSAFMFAKNPSFRATWAVLMP